MNPSSRSPCYPPTIAQAWLTLWRMLDCPTGPVKRREALSGRTPGRRPFPFVRTHSCGPAVTPGSAGFSLQPIRHSDRIGGIRSPTIALAQRRPSASRPHPSLRRRARRGQTTHARPPNAVLWEQTTAPYVRNASKGRNGRKAQDDHPITSAAILTSGALL